MNMEEYLRRLKDMAERDRQRRSKQRDEDNNLSARDF